MTPEALAALHALGFTSPRPWSAQEFSDLLESPHVFLVSNDKAFALGRAIAGEAELLTLVTHPNYRNFGRGRACLLEFEVTARQRNAQTVFLEVAANNFAARSLYRSAGYRCTGLRKLYYRLTDGESVDAEIYSKSLGSA